MASIKCEECGHNVSTKAKVHVIIEIDEESFHEYGPKTFSDLVKGFVKYKD